MSYNPESFSSATKALFESQIASFNALGNNTIKGIEKVMALNIAAAKEYADVSNLAARRLFSAKDPQALVELASAQAKSAAEKMTSYSHDLTNIASEIRADFSQAAEAQLTETKNQITALVNDVARSSPAGVEPMVALLRSAFDNASASYEQVTKSTRHAVETVEAQVINATEHFSQTTEKAAHKTTHINSKK